MPQPKPPFKTRFPCTFSTFLSANADSSRRLGLAQGAASGTSILTSGHNYDVGFPALGLYVGLYYFFYYFSNKSPFRCFCTRVTENATPTLPHPVGTWAAWAGWRKGTPSEQLC